jgi:hypothetical protein
MAGREEYAPRPMRLSIGNASSIASLSRVGFARSANLVPNFGALKSTSRIS